MTARPPVSPPSDIEPSYLQEPPKASNVPVHGLSRGMESEPDAVSQVRGMWYRIASAVAKDTILKARVDDELAEAVDRWAQGHEVDRSEAIRIALRRLIEDDQERERRIEEVRRRFDEYEAAGLFDEPEDDSWKASGGWS